MPAWDDFGREYNDWLADCCGQEQKMRREFSESGEGVNVQIFSAPDQVPADVSQIRVSPANQNRWVSHVFRTSSPPIGGPRKDTGSLVVDSTIHSNLLGMRASEYTATTEYR